VKKKPTRTLDLQPQDFPRSDPCRAGRLDPSTKVCTMNCTPCRVDPRSAAERKLQCDDCYPAPPPASPHQWSEAEAVAAAHAAGFAGTWWSMGPQELVHLLNMLRAQPCKEAL
jgi:hypothetical protein